MNLVDYYKQIYYDLLKSYWDERGRGARYRTLSVGASLFARRDKSCKVAWDAALTECVSRLKADGLVSEVGVERDGNILRLKVTGCVHEPEDRRVKETPGMEIFCCPIGNILMAAVDQTLGQRSELAQVEMSDNSCCTTIVVAGANLDAGTPT